uniref:Uncharacterized protein n=1 Tax=Arundo donax TaxID=35708 RepID=A0A0A8XU59_ARUDO
MLLDDIKGEESKKVQIA